MIVNCLFFAHYQDVVGRRDLAVTLRDDATVRDLALVLQEQYPTLGNLMEQGRAAVDAEFAQGHMPLHDRAEVAWMPPMSGGGFK